MNAAIGGHAHTGSYADPVRIVDARQTAKAFPDEGDEVALIIDGAGIMWLPELVEPYQSSTALFEALPHIATVCEYCADAFRVGDAIDGLGVEHAVEFDRQPRLRQLTAADSEVIRF